LDNSTTKEKRLHLHAPDKPSTVVNPRRRRRKKKKKKKKKQIKRYYTHTHTQKKPPPPLKLKLKKKKKKNNGSLLFVSSSSHLVQFAYNATKRLETRHVLYDPNGGPHHFNPLL
jgi:hypothetical protein